MTSGRRFRKGAYRLFQEDGEPITGRKRGRLVIAGRVRVVVDAWDQVTGNEPRRRLGLYTLGYQVLNADGTPAAGFQALDRPFTSIGCSRDPTLRASFTPRAVGSRSTGGARRVSSTSLRTLSRVAWRRLAHGTRPNFPRVTTPCASSRPTPKATWPPATGTCPSRFLPRLSPPTSAADKPKAT